VQARAKRCKLQPATIMQQIQLLCDVSCATHCIAALRYAVTAAELLLLLPFLLLPPLLLLLHLLLLLLLPLQLQLSPDNKEAGAHSYADA
jgi:hypothetical protein